MSSINLRTYGEGERPCTATHFADNEVLYFKLRPRHKWSRPRESNAEADRFELSRYADSLQAGMVRAG